MSPHPYQNLVNFTEVDTAARLKGQRHMSGGVLGIIVAFSAGRDGLSHDLTPVSGNVHAAPPLTLALENRPEWLIGHLVPNLRRAVVKPRLRQIGELFVGVMSDDPKLLVLKVTVRPVTKRLVEWDRLSR